MIWTLTHLKYFPVKRVVTNEIFSAQIFSDLILESFRQKKLNEKGQNSGNRQFFLNMRQSRPLFCVYFRPFRITIQVHKSWNKQRWCAWDLNPGLQNGWCSFGARHIFDTLSKFWYRGENSPPPSPSLVLTRVHPPTTWRDWTSVLSQSFGSPVAKTVVDFMK